MRKRQMLHSFHSFRVGRRAADVPFGAGRVGADDQEIVAGFEFAVAGSGGQEGYVAGADGDLMASFAAQDEAC